MTTEVLIDAYVDWFVQPDPEGPSQQWTSPLLEGSRVTANGSWTPYLQASLSVELDTDIADGIDPTRAPGIVRARVGFLRDLGAATEQQYVWDLDVRSVSRNHTAGTMSVAAMSGERAMDTSIWTSATPWAQASDDLQGEVHAVLTQVGLGLWYPPPAPFTIPEETEWSAGVSAGDYLRPLVDLAGYKLLFDHTNRAGLYLPGTPVGPGPTAPVAFTIDQLIEHEELTSKEARYADDVLVVYEWNDAAGAAHLAVDVSTPSGAGFPAWHVERVRGKYPGPGAADEIASRLLAWRGERTIRTLWDFDVRPGIVVTVDGPDGVTGGKVLAVTYHADGTMDITQSVE